MKPKYPQPYSIRKKFDLKIDNEALESRVIDYLHAKSKYESRQRIKREREK